LGLREKLKNRIQEIHDTIARTLPSLTARSNSTKRPCTPSTKRRVDS
jgi:hypothetical protein